MNTAIESNNKEKFEKIAYQQAMLGGLSAKNFLSWCPKKQISFIRPLNHRYLVLAGLDCFEMCHWPSFGLVPPVVVLLSGLFCGNMWLCVDGNSTGVCAW